MVETLVNFTCLFLFFSEMILLILKRSKSDKVKIRKDKSSMLILWLVISLSLFFAIDFANVYSGAERFLILECLGIFIFMLGIIIRFTAIYQLGKAFTVDVSIAGDQKIKDNGLYKKIRHPSYLGLMLEFLGISLLLNSWYSFLILNVPTFIALAYRIKVEEELLISSFGTEYENYKKRTKRILPLIY